MTARRNGCHDRAPYLPGTALVDHHGRLVDSFPFRMAPDCQYTKTELGQADAGCLGCRWRQGASATDKPAASP